MPNRIVREGINSSERVNDLSFGAELLYRRLMSVVDDFGRYHAAPVTIRAACWPTCPGKITDEQILSWLAELQQADDPLIVIYVVKKSTYLVLNNFKQQCRTASKFPPPPTTPEISVRQAVNRPMNQHDSSLLANCEQNDSKMLADCEQNDSTSRIRIRSAYSYSKAKENASSLESEPPKRFSELWDRWPRKRYQDSACRDYLSVVTGENETLMFQCAERYLASGEVADGAVQNLGSTPEKTGWLVDCARDNWKCEWPAAKNGHSVPDQRAEVLRILKERDAKRVNQL